MTLKDKNYGTELPLRETGLRLAISWDPILNSIILPVSAQLEVRWVSEE